MKNIKLLIVLLAISIFINIYQYLYLEKKEEAFDSVVHQIKGVNSTFEKIIGKNIVGIHLTPYFSGNYINAFDKTILVYANLTGCGKCIDHHLRIASKINEQSNIRYIFYAFNKAQIKQAILKYNIKKNVFWDENDELSKYMESDTRKMNPFVLLVFDGRPAVLKFSYENDFDYLNFVHNLLRKHNN